MEQIQVTDDFYFLITRQRSNTSIKYTLYIPWRTVFQLFRWKISDIIYLFFVLSNEKKQFVLVFDFNLLEILFKQKKISNKKCKV